MTSAGTGFGPGKITLTVVVGRGDDDGLGRVEAVRVGSSRPVGFSSTLFVGRPADEVPALVGRLHALCGLSHATASAMAIAAARGEDADRVMAERFDGLAAERLGEHLRSIFMGPTGGSAGFMGPTGGSAGFMGPTGGSAGFMGPTGGSAGFMGPGGLEGSAGDGLRETLADLRGVLASARGLMAAPGGPAGAAARGAAIDEVRRGTARLGLRLGAEGRLDLAPGSWAATVVAACAEGDTYLEADPLRAEDDVAVVSALAADPIGFSAAPRLGDRRPETGPFARSTARAGRGSCDGRARLEARFAEIAGAAASLGGGSGEAARWAGAGLIEPRTGYAAVESPRGRLHHLVGVDAAGRVASHAILAPTEWNFGPRGPLVATLMANRLPPDRRGAAQVERIAAAFDPCVGFAVEVEERAHA